MKTEKHIITPQDLELNPELGEAGVKPGEEIELGDLCNEDGTPVEDPEDESANKTADSDAPADGPGPRPKDRNNP